MSTLDDLNAKVAEVVNATQVLFPALENRENLLTFLEIPNDLASIENELLKLAAAPDLITIQGIIRDSAQDAFDAKLILINVSPESAIDELVFSTLTAPEIAALKVEYLKVLEIDIANKEQEIEDATGIVII